MPLLKGRKNSTTTELFLTKNGELSMSFDENNTKDPITECNEKLAILQQKYAEISNEIEILMTNHKKNLLKIIINC